MKSDTPLDYAVFQLSPKRSRCELLVSSGGDTEKLASGSVKPFTTQLKVAEEQVGLAVQSIRLEVEKSRSAERWFTKGTLERFVRFVSTPEVVELVNTFDAEMSQLEAARKIYFQGMGDQQSGGLGGDGTGTTAAADATKKELLRAIDVRLSAVKQDLTTAYARASAAGFNPDAISDLQAFADRFGAHRLNEACTKFVSFCQRRPELSNGWKPSVNSEAAVRSSYGSDMSIDDPTEDSSGLTRHLDQPRDATCQQPKSQFSTTTTTSSSFPTLRNNTNVNNEVKEETTKEEPGKVKEQNSQTESSSSSSSTLAPAGPPASLLSVQQRINLFESKQKEQSSTGSGGKPVVVKSVELRRLSSDVSSSASALLHVGPEKAVLRRWSGASDMSLDLSAEKKDSGSPLCTPSSASSVSQAKSSNIVQGASEVKDQKGSSDSVSSTKADTVVVSDNKEEDSGSKEQAVSQPQFKFSFLKAEQVVGLNDQKVSQEKSRTLLNSEERISGFKDQSRGSSEIPGVKFPVDSHTQPVSFSSKGNVPSDGGFGNKVEDFEPVAQSLIPPRPKNFHSHSQSSGLLDFGGGLKLKETALTQQKWGNIGDQLPAQNQWRSATVGFEGSEGESISSPGTQQTEAEDLGLPKMKPQKPISSAREPVKKSQVKRDESISSEKESKLDFNLKKVSVSQESSATVSKPPVEQVQRVRQSKGNQELNDELKMKANELEKLFAEHKLRVPVDQSGSARRSKLTDMQVEAGPSLQYKNPEPDEIAPSQLPEKSTATELPTGSSDKAKFSTPVTKKVDAMDSADSLRRNFSELGLSDESRGKFYERYMQKRDAKLREELGSKGAERKAKLKAMQVSLEQSSAELKAKFSGSADKTDSRSSARWRAEKLRSFNMRSGLKRGQSIDSLPSEEDDDPSEFPGQRIVQDRFLSEGSSGEGASRPTQLRKPLPNRNLSSSTPRTSAAPAPRSSAKLSNSNSGRRRAQSENPMAQSVPNFSDLRKENTKPSSGVSKTATRLQVRSYVRNKSISEEVPNVGKEDKARRPHTLRKSVANPVEFKDLSSLNPESVVLSQLKFDKEQAEQSAYEKLPKTTGTKPFLRKGNGIGPGSGASIAKLKASIVLETLQNEELDDLGLEADDYVDIAKEEEVEEDDVEEGEELEDMVVDDRDHVDNGKSRLSHESDKSGNFESDNGDSTRSLSHMDPASVTELPAAMPSAFHAIGALQDSPGESPVSWNSRLHPFSYPNETSDVDASVDSPIGSPASWNSHGLTQMEAEAARMRKKWGSAQKPVIASNSSYNQSRKDMTKGFKRLLKFGRKNRGTETMVDWISATTSEGDDDTEDGRDLANRSSEDLRKSRMGFFQGPSDDSFNDSEFNEQVQSLQSSIPAPPVNFKLRDDHLSGSSLKAPRSFFSLSSFRSKGGDSKPR